MKTLLLLLAFLLPLAAEDVALVPKPARLSVLTNVQVRKSGAFQITVTWPDGAGASTYPAWELTVAQQRKSGFDPVAVAAEQKRVLAKHAATDAANQSAGDWAAVRAEHDRCKTALLHGAKPCLNCGFAPFTDPFAAAKALLEPSTVTAGLFNCS